MPHFQKIPLTLEAIRLTSHITLDGEQGTIEGRPGDWLVTGIEGEQYIVPHSRFVRLYEPADEAAGRYLEDVDRAGE